MRVRCFAAVLAYGLAGCLAPVFADSGNDLQAAYEDLERRATRSSALLKIGKAPHVTLDEMRQVDPREAESQRLFREVVGNRSLPMEQRAEAAGRNLELSTQLTQDKDFVLFKYAREGHLTAGLIPRKLTSAEAKRRLERGESVRMEYWVLGSFGTREVTSIEQVMHLERLLNCEYLKANNLGIPPNEALAFRLLKLYTTVDNDPSGGLKLRHGLEKPGHLVIDLDPVQAFYRLRDRQTVVVYSYRGGQQNLLGSLEELDAFARKDLLSRFSEQALGLLWEAWAQ